jgi:hypothetical protein
VFMYAPDDRPPLGTTLAADVRMIFMITTL